MKHGFLSENNETGRVQSSERVERVPDEDLVFRPNAEDARVRSVPYFRQEQPEVIERRGPGGEETVTKWPDAR